MDTKDPDIRNQDAAYRRGLVLGLTMAEILILILFALMLALAASLASNNQESRAKDERIAELSILEKSLRDQLLNDTSAVTVEDIVQKLVRQEQEIAQQKEAIAGLESEIEQLTSLEENSLLLDDIVREIRRESTSDITAQDVVEKLKALQKLAKDNENLRGQNMQMSRQIKESGRGNEFPSCWVTPDGRIESIFEVTFEATGIVIRDRRNPRRLADIAELPLTMLRYDIELPLLDFQNQLRPLYKWSVENKCRFYVIRYSSSMNVRRDLMNAVDAYFYPDSSIQIREGHRTQ